MSPYQNTMYIGVDSILHLFGGGGGGGYIKQVNYFLVAEM